MIAPKAKKFEYSINLFDGGKVSKIQPSELLPNQSPDLQNIKFSTIGHVETVDGYSAINSRIASSPIDGMAVHKASASATEYLIVACNGTVYRTETGTMSAITGSTAIFTAENDVKFTRYKNYLYCSDGLSYGYKYDGSEMTQAGIRPISATVNIVSGTTDVSAPHTAGTYVYGMTGVNNASQEGGFVTFSSYVLSVATHSINLSNVPVYPDSASVVSRNLYRIDPSLTTYKLLDTLANNTATTYIDIIETSSTSYSTTGYMPEHKYMVEYLGRLFCAGSDSYPTRLYYSEAGYPEDWPPANYIETGEDDGYPISGLTIYNGSVIIFKNDGYGNGCVYILDISDTSPANWVKSKTNAQYSAIGGKSFSGDNNKLVFLTRTGVYNFMSNFLADNPQFTTLGSFAVDNISWPIEPDVLALNYEYLKKSALVEHKSKIYMAVPKTENYNDTIYVYDHSTISSINRNTGSWIPLTGPQVNNFVEYKGKLYGGDSSDGFIYELLKTNNYNFNGSSISSYYITPYIYGNEKHKNNHKTWRNAYIGVELVGDWNLIVSYREDSNYPWYDTTISLKPEGSLWDLAQWDEDNWGENYLRKICNITILNLTSQMIQFKFSVDTVDQYFRIFSFRLEYNLRGQRL